AVRQATPIAEAELAGASHLRIEPPHLIVELIQREPTTAEKLETYAGQLLVPGRKRLVEGGWREPTLEEMVSALHHAPVAPVRGEMCGKELSGEAVREAAPGLGPAVDDGQVLPAEWDHARPGTPFAGDDPGTVVPRGHYSLDRARGVVAPNLSRNRGVRGVPANEIGRSAASKRASNEDETEAFEEIRLALAVGGRGGGQGRGWRIGERRIVTKIRQHYPVDIHPEFAPP